MPFASTELAARIEAAEGELVLAYAQATAQRRPEVDVWTRRIAGGIATLSEPASPLNKVAGLGFAGAVDERALAEIEEAFAARAIPLPIELSSLAEPGLAAMLTKRGYALVGFENVLGRALPWRDAPAPAAGVTIETVDPDEIALWLDVVVTGFASPDTQGVASHESFPRDVLERIAADAAATPGLVRQLARVDGVPAAAGSMRLGGGIAQLCGAATLPAFRRRGVHTALLAARLAHAGAHGGELAVVTTLPGSKSQQNVQRFGFEVLYTRAILVRGG